jgi:PadR family transcriptional regulator, regulatory protein PadR
MEQQFQDLELTPRMADVLKIFLEDPSTPRYGFELMRATHQPSGTLYPILARLEKAGWLSLGKEDIDPRAEGRPARRFYRITGRAIPVARSQLAALSERYKLPNRIHSRLITESGSL